MDPLQPARPTSTRRPPRRIRRREALAPAPSPTAAPAPPPPRPVGWLPGLVAGVVLVLALIVLLLVLGARDDPLHAVPTSAPVAPSSAAPR